MKKLFSLFLMMMVFAVSFALPPPSSNILLDDPIEIVQTNQTVSNVFTFENPIVQVADYQMVEASNIGFNTMVATRNINDYKISFTIGKIGIYKTCFKTGAIEGYRGGIMKPSATLLCYIAKISTGNFQMI